jgi:type IV pilus assembly protein PilO
MVNFNEIPASVKQWTALLGGSALLTGALFFTVSKSERDANRASEQKLATRMRENAELESYRPKLADLDRQVGSLKQQLEIERHIVPDDKEVDGFLKMLDAEAAKAGIEVRRYTAKPVQTKEFYSELPFDMELDGPYYAVVNFFDQVSKLERIVNIGNLLIATPKKGSEAKTKHTYQYAANESIVATCTASTFFSHDLEPASAPVKK